jgi:hypothetical protein
MRWVISLVFVGCVSGTRTAAPDPAAVNRTVLTDRQGTVLRTIDADRPATALVAAPPSKVWKAAALAYYGDLGVEVKTADSESGLVGNRQFSRVRQLAGKPMATYVDCGSDIRGVTANSYRITMSLLSTATPDPAGGTRLETRLTAEGQPLGVSGDPVHCISTGRLEQRIAEGVRRRVGQ